MDNSDSRATPADARVIFGATGDLVHKTIFPAHPTRWPGAAFSACRSLTSPRPGVAPGGTAQTGDGEHRASRQDR
jgi:hypothetical protein